MAFFTSSSQARWRFEQLASAAVAAAADFLLSGIVGKDNSSIKWRARTRKVESREKKAASILIRARSAKQNTLNGRQQTNTHTQLELYAERAQKILQTLREVILYDDLKRADEQH